MKYIFFTIALLVLFQPQQADSAWFNSSYTQCRKMTMNSSLISTTTTAGFALVATSTLSDLSATSSGGTIELYNVASGTPIDVVITNGTDCNSDGGTKVDFFFEKYASTTGQNVLWIESTDVSSTTDKTVLMYYGNSTATDQSNEAGVFGTSGEVGVWNLSEDPSGTAPQMKDSTTNGNHGTTSGTMTLSDQVDSQVDGGLDFDGSNDYVDMGDISPTIGSDTEGSVSLWFSNNNDTLAPLFSYGVSGSNNTIFRITFASANTVQVLLKVGSTDSYRATVNLGASSSDGSWHHIVFRVNASGNALYYDGSPVTLSYSSGSATQPDWFDDLIGENIAAIGSDRIGSPSYFNGKMDDLRMYDRALTQSDITTIYNNTKKPSFWTIGAAETESGGATPAIPQSVIWFN